MPKLRVAIQLASLDLPFKKALLTAAELGADGVEIDARGEVGPRQVSRTGVRELRKMLEDLNLQACAVGFRTRRGYQIADDLDRRIEGTKEAQRFAFSLGASVVVNHLGAIPAEPSGREWDLLVQSLTELGLHGQRVGATLTAATGAESPADLGRLIAALPSGSLGVTFDPGSLIVHGFSASEALGALAEHVLHVHARDGVRDLARGRGLETQLGRGSVDFPELLGVLEQRGYRGCYTLVRENAVAPVEELGQALQYLRNL